MSQKMTCPGCSSHTSSVLAAVEQGEPCPYCGLSAAAIGEVNVLRRQREDDALAARLEDALLRADRAEASARDLQRRLNDVRTALDEGDNQ